VAGHRLRENQAFRRKQMLPALVERVVTSQPRVGGRSFETGHYEEVTSTAIQNCVMLCDVATCNVLGLRSAPINGVEPDFVGCGGLQRSERTQTPVPARIDRKWLKTR
jgi:hypothetical protein